MSVVDFLIRCLPRVCNLCVAQTINCLAFQKHEVQIARIDRVCGQSSGDSIQVPQVIIHDEQGKQILLSPQIPESISLKIIS